MVASLVKDMPLAPIGVAADLRDGAVRDETTSCAHHDDSNSVNSHRTVGDRSGFTILPTHSLTYFVSSDCLNIRLRETKI